MRIAIWNAFKAAYTPGTGLLPNQAIDESLVAKDLVLGAELCLFAPAHFGSRLPKWLANTLALILGMPSAGPALLDCLGVLVPALYHLQPDDVVLSDTRRFTEEFSEKYPFVQAFRARILWGSKDKVVVNWQYKWDHPVEYVEGMGHTDICKLHPPYVKPLDFVSYGRKRKNAAR